MSLYNYIISEQNIYLAIYSLKSYIYDKHLLSKEDIMLYEKLLDPFNENVTNQVISDVRKIIENIIKNDNTYFDVQVYFIPKSYDVKSKDAEDKKAKFRPIHIADIRQLIAMVSMFQVIIYDIPNEQNQYRLNLSDYCRLIPYNFYGNKISPQVGNLYMNWNTQYSKFVEKSNRFFREGRDFGKYKFEVKLDIINFFPSVNPILIYGLLLEHMPVTIMDQADVDVFKKVIYKLIKCKVNNLNTSEVKERYYDSADTNTGDYFTRGLPQGLPQSYFFGNLCMVKIADIISETLKGDSLYYVDDVYVYTNIDIENENSFNQYLFTINDKIKKMETKYLPDYWDYINGNMNLSNLDVIVDRFMNDKMYIQYNIQFHHNKKGKSEYIEINKNLSDNYGVRNLKHHVSQVGSDIKKMYSEKEEEILLHNIEAMVNAIETELNNAGEMPNVNKKRLISYYKFFKYRMIKLKLRTKNYSKNDLFKILLGGNSGETDLDYKSLENYVPPKEVFFDKYQNDIWLNAVNLLIENTIYEHEYIKNYLKNIIKLIYGENMMGCSYVKRYFDKYLENDYIDYQILYNTDRYATLKNKCNTLLKYYSELNNEGLNSIFSGTRMRGICNNPLESYNICSKSFLNMSIIVQKNSGELQRMFLNAVYSRVFKINISDEFVLNSYDKKGITYGTLRCLVYLRNKKCNVSNFLNWSIDITSDQNKQTIDYSIINVLDIYKTYIREPHYIDCLILVHKYTSDVWKNGARHLYFYTLHNQEHAVELIKNITLLVKVFKNLSISNYNYYILFIACYLHDIGMVKIADEKELFKQENAPDKIIDKLDYYKKLDSVTDKKEFIIKVYKEVDQFYESLIRDSHAKNSAYEIRRQKELSFLDSSLRECVAKIAEAHADETGKIYVLDASMRNSIINYTNDKILLRLADLMDMCQNRATRIILNHNFGNISSKSAFHWISHLLTQNCELSADYNYDNKKIQTGQQNNKLFQEIVKLTVNVNFSQFSKMTCMKCEHGRIEDDSISSSGFKITMLGENKKCDSNKCNFLCRWFNVKNNYLMKEMQALEQYFNKIQSRHTIHNIKIEIQVNVTNQICISDSEFEILRNEIKDD